jgi:hypothetical protein
MPLYTAVAEKTFSANGDGLHRNVPRLARRSAFALTIVCAIILLYPVIASPITADDRYWYLWTTARADGSVGELLRWSWERTPSRVDSGRLNVLTELERRLAGLAIVKVAVATSTPIAVYQALLKLALFGGGILTVLAFIRSLRWRSSDGRLVQVSRRALVLVGMAGTLTVAVGVQAQNQDRNGWTAYPVSTYGAVISIFGSIALLLWLTRLVAERSRAMTVAAIVVLILLAIATNFRYELTFPAVPIAAIALVVVPVTDRARRGAGRRAKVVTGSAYVGAFISFFVATRVYLARVCGNQDCYVGVEPELGLAAVRTAAYNFLSAIPGAGGNELRANLDRVGWGDRYPVPPQWWSVLVGVGALVALLTTWWSMRRSHPVAVDSDTGVHGPSALNRAEALMLFVGAGLAMLVALGTAVVMGLSGQSHDIITQPGTPYRNTMVSWTSLAFCLVLVVVALGIVRPRRAALVTWTALAVSIGTIAALTLPGNLMALRAHRITHTVTEAFNWEVVKGDLTPAGDARRCELFAEIEQESTPRVQRSMRNYSTVAFQQFYGQSFCIDPEQSGISE